MKSALVISGLLVSSSALAESFYDEVLYTQFREAAEACQIDVDNAVAQGREVLSLKDCYADKVAQTMSELKRQNIKSPWFYGTYVKLPKRTGSNDQDNFLIAAMKADPILTLTAFNAALDANMDVYYATEVASAYLPNQRDDFSRIAIRHGAAPDRVTTATAAGQSEGSF